VLALALTDALNTANSCQLQNYIPTTVGQLQTQDYTLSRQSADHLTTAAAAVTTKDML